MISDNDQVSLFLSLSLSSILPFTRLINCILQDEKSENKSRWTAYDAIECYQQREQRTGLVERQLSQPYST